MIDRIIEESGTPGRTRWLRTDQLRRYVKCHSHTIFGIEVNMTMHEPSTRVVSVEPDNSVTTSRNVYGVFLYGVRVQLREVLRSELFGVTPSQVEAGFVDTFDVRVDAFLHACSGVLWGISDLQHLETVTMQMNGVVEGVGVGTNG